MPPRQAEILYADADVVLRQGWSAFKGPDLATVADWAAGNRWLSNPGGGYSGRWSDAEAPYLREPMEALTDPDHTTIAIVGPGQSGKTEVAHNWLAWGIENDPANMLWYMQTDPGLEAHVKNRIQPLIDAHPELRHRLGGLSSDNTLHFKRFGTMTVEFLSATPSSLINKSAGRIVADEVDAYADSLGDVKALLDVRRQTFGRRSKLLMISHPDRARGLDAEKDWTAGIMATFADSDRRTWWSPCPHCGVFSCMAPIGPRQFALHYPESATLDDVEAEARLACPANGCLIENAERRAMLQAGRWLRLGEHMEEDGRVTGEAIRRDIAGFWITGIMSLLNRGIGSLARALEKAKRDAEASGDDDTLREVWTKQLGVPYGAQRRPGMVDAQALRERAEPGLRLGEVPDGVRFITASCDIQRNRFELLFRGWLAGGASTIIDHQRLAAEPAISAADWDTMLAALIEARFPLADGSGRTMAVRAVTWDSGGDPGVTEQAYAAWLRWRHARRIRSAGRVEGRDAWQALPAKGAATPGAPRLAVTYPDAARKDRKAAARGQIPLLLFNTNWAKDDLAGHLAAAAADRGQVHFPADLLLRTPDAYEQLCAERRDSRGRWSKINQTTRNELVDLMVMSHAVAVLHGLRRLNWEKPPGWAAEWGTNTLVAAATGPVPVAAASPAPPAPVAPATVVIASAATAVASRRLASRLA